MNNQKKIEEILLSIQELILEAQNEERLDRLNTNELIDLNKINQSKTEDLLKKQDSNELTYNKTTKKMDIILPNSNSHSKNSWRDLNFENCQERPQHVAAPKLFKLPSRGVYLTLSPSLVLFGPIICENAFQIIPNIFIFGCHFFF